MTKKFLYCFRRADFQPAVEEMLRLYLPGVELTALTEKECQECYHRPAEEDILIEGLVGQEGNNIDGLARLHYMCDGQLTSVRQQRIVDMLPWENKISAERRVVRLLLNALFKHYFRAQASPWGILRGIRPSKLVHRLLDAERPVPVIREILQKDYDVEEDKAALITDIAVRQRPFLLSRDQARRLVSIYLGIPFCPSRCLYCSFPSFPITGEERKVEQFLNALRREIEAVQQFFLKHGLQVQTLYIGGGTPTSLPDKAFKQLLADVREAFHGKALREFTVEAGRPDTLSLDKLDMMHEQGVNRISINPQTMREHTLRAIGRSHRPEDVERVFRLARQAGFQNINMDLIAGLPGETPEDMIYTLDRLGEMGPENLTVHTLAVKRGSELKEKTGYCLPQGQIVREMLGLCAAAAQNLGLNPYYLYRQKYMAGNLENVGYALSGKECLYNIQIMEERQSIVGLGAAAGTKAVDPDGWKVASCYNPKDVNTYVNKLNTYVQRKLTLLHGIIDE